MELEAARNAPITYEKGQRLHCESCESEIEIISPGTETDPNLDLRCCGQPMTASVGRQVNLGVE